MITMKEYDPKDWLEIIDAVEPFLFLESLDEFNKVAQRGIAVTAVEDGEVMACGGVAYINNDEGIVWVKISKRCLRHSFRWARTIKETFGLMMDAMKPVKIITYIQSDFCKGEKLARLIGMKKLDETFVYNDLTYNKFTVVI